MAITLGKLQPGASSPLGVGVSIKYVSWFTAVKSFSASRGGMLGIGNTGTVNARMVVYADNAGVPGALLGQSDPRTFADGTFTGDQQFVFSTPVAVQAGTKYWIGSHADGAISFAYDTIASASYYNLSNPDTFSDGASNPFLTGAGGLGTSSQLSVWLSDGGVLNATTRQIVAEVIRTATPKVQIDQVALETVRAALATAQLHTVAVEIVRGNGAEVSFALNTVAPSSGQVGAAVTLSGSGFSGAGPNPTITFGGIPANNVVVVNNTTITCTAPNHALGAVSVAIPALGLTAAFTYTPLVKFDGVLATITSVLDANRVIVSTPAHASAVVDVEATFDVATTTGVGVYTYDVGFGITSINIASGSIAGGTAVTVSGSGFSAGTTVTFGGVAATNVIIVNDNTLTCQTPAHGVGVVDVAVTADGQTDTLTGAFTYVVPPIVATPNHGPTYGGNRVRLTF